MNIPNYEIKKELGQGGMATVYLAEQTMLSRDVALKILLPDMVKDEKFRKNFLSEGKIVANLEHPNIVRVYDVGITDDSIYYMAMEYFSEGTLKEKIVKGKLSLEESISILDQVGSGLAYAHEQGFIHRDIKPANILFHANDRAVLSDFGIAKLQDTSGDLTQMGYVQGTLQYMSPEQATTTDLDQRCDVYSLGLVFYEMLTGEIAYKSDTTVQAIYQHTTAPPPHLPQEYAQYQPILNKVLAKIPNDRFSTVTEFLQAVKNPGSAVDDRTIVFTGAGNPNEGQTIHAIPEKNTEIVIPEVKSKKMMLLGGIAASFLAIAAIFGVMHFKEQAAAEEARIVEAEREKERVAQEVRKKAEEERIAKQEIMEKKKKEQEAKEKEEAERIAKLEADKKAADEKVAKLEAEKAEKRKAEKKRLAKIKRDKIKKEQVAKTRADANRRAKQQQAAKARNAQAQAQARAQAQVRARQQQEAKNKQQPAQKKGNSQNPFAKGFLEEAGKITADGVLGRFRK